MIRTVRRLTAQVSNAQTERSLFAYQKNTGSEIASNNNPSNLESLVRLVSAVESFKYPAFNPALQDIVSKEGDQDWIDRITSEASQIPHGVALQYLKALAPAEVPSELLLAILKRVRVNSRQDVAEFVSAISQLTPSEFTPDVRSATTFVLKNAVVNQCRLSTYNSIFELVDKHWHASRKHLVYAKLRTDLSDAGWSAFLRLNLTSEDSDFADAVKWLSFNEPIRGRKEDIAAKLAEVEARAKSYVPHELLVPILSAIFENQKVVIPEPLDSITQLLARKLRIYKLSIAELEELVGGLTRYFDAPRRAPQLEPVVDMILPTLLKGLEKHISSLPSRSMPGVLGLLSRSGESNLVMQELERRGHEMSGPELVRLINSLEWVDPELLKSLFSAKLGEARYVDGLLQSLNLKDRIELLASLASSGIDLSCQEISILVTSLRENINLDSELPIDTIVRILAAGDAAFAGTNIIPSELVKEFLESENSGQLTEDQTLRLMRAPISLQDEEIAKSLFRHIESAPLSCGQSVELLRASLACIRDRQYIEKVLKILVPKIPEISGEIDQLLELIPSELNRWADQAVYAPANQFKVELLTRTAGLSPQMEGRAVSVCLKELGRLGFVSGQSEVLDALVKRGLEASGPLVVSQQEAVSVVDACRSLGIYSSDFLDLVVRDFLALSQRNPETVAALARALVAVGNKNDSVLTAAENILRQPGDISISTRVLLLNSLAKSGVFSPMFVEQFRRLMEEAAMNLSLLSDQDWVQLFETHLAVLVEAPPKVKVRFANDAKLKAFVDENCAFSWYASQEKQRNLFIHSRERGEIHEAMQSLGWSSMRVPELGKEVYHVDFVSESSEKGPRVAVVCIPPSDELSTSSGVRIIVGDSMTKVKHLQLFGYKVVPVWLKEWQKLSSPEERKKCMLRNSTQVVFALGAGRGI
jgi:hypothetical protein